MRNATGEQDDKKKGAISPPPLHTHLPTYLVFIDAEAAVLEEVADIGHGGTVTLLRCLGIPHERLHPVLRETTLSVVVRVRQPD